MRITNGQRRDCLPDKNAIQRANLLFCPFAEFDHGRCPSIRRASHVTVVGLVPIVTLALLLRLPCANAVVLSAFAQRLGSHRHDLGVCVYSCFTKSTEQGSGRARDKWLGRGLSIVATSPHRCRAHSCILWYMNSTVSSPQRGSTRIRMAKLCWMRKRTRLRQVPTRSNVCRIQVLWLRGKVVIVVAEYGCQHEQNSVASDNSKMNFDFGSSAIAFIKTAERSFPITAVIFRYA